MNLTIVDYDTGYEIDRRHLNDYLQAAERLNVNAVVKSNDINSIDELTADTDAIIFRHGSLGLDGLASLANLMNGKIFVNTGYYRNPESQSKLFQQRILAQSALANHAIPTLVIQNGNQLNQLIESEKISLPLVAKPYNGTDSRGLSVITTKADIAKIQSVRQVVQPYIHARAEWRVFVVGGVAIGAMRKTTANPDQFPRLLSRNYSVANETDIDLCEKLFDLAERVSSLFHYELSGIDIAQDDRSGNLYVYELNGTPGWRNGFDRVTGENIPEQVIGWMKERYDCCPDAVRNHRALANAIERYLRNRLQRLPADCAAEVKALLGDSDTFDSDIWAACNNKILMREADHKKAFYSPETLKLRQKSAPADLPLGDGFDFLSEKARELSEMHAEKSEVIKILNIVNGILSRNFFDCGLTAKLKFAYLSRKYDYPTSLIDLITAEAVSKISWAGNFIVGGGDPDDAISDRHTLRQNAVASAYFVLLANDRR